MKPEDAVCECDHAALDHGEWVGCFMQPHGEGSDYCQCDLTRTEVVIAVSAGMSAEYREVWERDGEFKRLVQMVEHPWIAVDSSYS